MARRKKPRPRNPEKKTFDALSVTKHQGTGLGYLRLGGKRVYVGPFDSPDLERRARRAYDRRRAGPAAEDGVTIARLIDLYLEHDAEVRYSKGGKPTSALTRCRVALQRLSDLFGDLPAETFRQQDFRAYWIDVLERPPGGGEKIMRDTAARYAAAVKDLFVWGGTHGYVTCVPTSTRSSRCPS